MSFANTTNHAGDATRPVSLTVKMVGDINGDGHVNAADLALVAASWGRKTGDADFDPACDLNGDGRVSVADLNLMARNWGK